MCANLWNDTVDSGGAPPATIPCSCIFKHVFMQTHMHAGTLAATLWKAAWLWVKGSLLPTVAERERADRQPSRTVTKWSTGGPRHVCRDLKALFSQALFGFCSPQQLDSTQGKKAFLAPFSVHSFSLFTLSDLAAFWQLIQFLCTKGNDVLNWIIGSFL